MHSLTEKLLHSIRKDQSFRAGDRVAVAVSGGADSVALLLLLMEVRPTLGIVLSVAHVNHKLRAQESDEDAEFVARLAEQFSLELHLKNAPLEGNSKTQQSDSDNVPGIEAAARDLRYAFFRELAKCGKISKAATAHTLDDQAETVLLRIFRGTGIRGLTGIHRRIVFEEQGKSFGEVLRPLLAVRRAALNDFLRDHGQSWREDSSNTNLIFDRNRVRHNLLPLLVKEFGNAAIEHMSELAEIARAEEDHWKSMHPELWPPQEVRPEAGKAPSKRSPSLALDPLLALPLAAQRRLLLRWLQVNAPEARISFRLIEEALELARQPSVGILQLSHGCNLRRVDNRLLLGRATQEFSGDYAYSLNVPGTAAIPELCATVEALEVDTASMPEKIRGQLLDIERMPRDLLIRNWRPGERYWPANTAAPKKIKELLADSHSKGFAKKLWPVAEFEGSGIVYLRGFDAPAAWQAPYAATRAIWIREVSGVSKQAMV